MLGEVKKRIDNLRAQIVQLSTSDEIKEVKRLLKLYKVDDTEARIAQYELIKKEFQRLAIYGGDQYIDSAFLGNSKYTKYWSDLRQEGVIISWTMSDYSRSWTAYEFDYTRYYRFIESIQPPKLAETQESKKINWLINETAALEKKIESARFENTKQIEALGATR